MDDKKPPTDGRGGGSDERSKKLSSQIFRRIEKSCDWSVTNHENLCFKSSTQNAKKDMVGACCHLLRIYATFFAGQHFRHYV